MHALFIQFLKKRKRGKKKGKGELIWRVRMQLGVKLSCAYAEMYRGLTLNRLLRTCQHLLPNNNNHKILLVGFREKGRGLIVYLC